MSVQTDVFLNPQSMPSPAVWARAIREAGFEMEMNSDFDVKTQAGFLPCSYKGKAAGFEYFYERCLPQGGIDSVLVSLSPMNNWPDVGRSSRPMMLRRVLFPEPEGPVRATNSPR